jgi:alkanesulfonate monooxygenase SsuD/methylene tetrahydromethanopterin reductase-like flavin-dependent oxidoreductase (luciferase family)
MLRLVAEHAQMWNSIASVEDYRHKSAVLDEYCRRIGRDPREIERTANVTVRSEREVEEWLDAGLQHFVLRLAQPFDTKGLERVLRLRDS